MTYKKSLLSRFAEWINLPNWNFWHLLRLPSLSDFTTLRKGHEYLHEYLEMQLEEIHGISSKIFGIVSKIQRENHDMLWAISAAQDKNQAQLQEKLHKSICLQEHALFTLMKENTERLDKISETFLDSIAKLQQRLEQSLAQYATDVTTNIQDSTKLNKQSISALAASQEEFRSKILNELVDFQKNSNSQMKNVERNNQNGIKSLYADLIRLEKQETDVICEQFSQRQKDIENLYTEITYIIETHKSLNKDHQELLQSLNTSFSDNAIKRERQFAEQVKELVTNNESANQTLGNLVNENAKIILEIESKCTRLLEALRLLFVNSLMDKINVEETKSIK